jgi:hypothetical protein
LVVVKFSGIHRWLQVSYARAGENVYIHREIVITGPRRSFVAAVLVTMSSSGSSSSSVSSYSLPHALPPAVPTAGGRQSSQRHAARQP